MTRLAPALIAIVGGLLMEIASAEDGPSLPVTPVAIDAEAVARLPHPGTVVPGAITFARDGLSVWYLKSETNSLSRVLWQPMRVVCQSRE